MSPKMARSSENTMMRIAIAGSGGLARVFAQYINETAHPFLILSRQAQPQLQTLGYQVAVVDYDSQDDLRYHLRGIDLVISTVQGSPQINLIDAAAHSRVRRFVPAEFEGPLARRPRNDPLDRGRAASLERLRHYSHHPRHPMRSTVFTCGVFYERFARGGLDSMGIGASTGNSQQGAFLMDVERRTAEIVEFHTSGQPIHLCLTSVEDLGRFMVAAIALNPDNWPGEFRMQGDRLTVTQVIQSAESVTGGVEFATTIIQPRDLAAHVEHASYYQDYAKVHRMNELIAADQRRYDFTQANLNPLVDFVPTTFWSWISYHWG